MITNRTANGNTCDAAKLKRLASGRCLEIITALCPVEAEALDGRHHPCPKCGGTDRFRAFNDFDETGGVFCNQCHSEKNGDVLATVQWMRDCDFPTACRLVSEYLGVGGCLNGHNNNGHDGQHNGNGTHNNQKPKTTYETANDAVAASERIHGPRSTLPTYEGDNGLWRYRNARRELVGVVVRWDNSDGSKKTVRPVARCDDGRWVLSGMPAPRPLYRLPDLENAERVLLCEGEKPADAARSIGFVATTSAHGANSAAQTDWSPLAGKEVIITPDNDKPGEKYANDVASILTNLSPPATVKIVRLDGLPDGGDFYDWLEQRDAHDSQELRHHIDRLADDADEWKPSADDEIELDEPDDDDDEPAKSFTFHSAAVFDGLDLRRDYHVPGILAAGPVPTILAGAFKTLKTSVVIDLLISLATQHRFLNHFPVSRRVRVAVMSGESGGFALQNLARRVSQSKGWAFGRIEDWFSICTAVPNLSSSADVDAIERYVVERDIGVLAIDPTYLAMPNVRADDAGSIFAMGKLLRSLSRLGERTGCTPLIVHHNTRSSIRMNSGEPAELADIAWSGFAEWAGQWVLLSRREKYDPDSDGEHRLWLTAGGRDGHSTLVGMDVTEGRSDSPQGRRWDVDVVDAGKVRAEAMEAAHERKAEQQGARKQKQAEDDCTAIVDAMRRIGEPQTKTAIREQCGIGHRGFNVAFADLLSDETIVPIQIMKGNNRTYDGFQLQQPASARNSPSDAGRCNRSSNGPPPHRGGGSVAPALLPLGGFNDEQETGPVGADADCTDDGDDKWWPDEIIG